MLELTPFELTAVLLSLRVAVVAVVFSFPVALAVAWLLARTRFFGKSVIDGLVHLPLVLPPVVVGYALLMGFGKTGPIGAFLEDKLGFTFAFNWKGAALAAAVMGFPLMVRALRLSIEAIDPALERTARTLGAGPLKAWLSITLPLMAPGILAGCLLSFARALGEFGATITFVANIPGQTQTLPLAIYTALQTPQGGAAALRLTLLSVIIAFAALAGSELVNRRLGRRLYGTA